MSEPIERPTQPGALPVLTEELEQPAADTTQERASSDALHAAAAMPCEPAGTAMPHVGSPSVQPEALHGPSSGDEPGLDARTIEDEVMAELSQRIDLMFEYRLREALAPTLARAADLLIREAREEVALTLRDVVSRAVARQLSRRRPGR